MPKMQIVTDEMLNRASKIGQDTTNILEKQNMVTNIFRNMGRNFSGKIPSLMTQHMLGMEKEYKTMNGILTNYKDFLEDSAYNYDWKEDELARFAESLGNPGANSSDNLYNTDRKHPSGSTNTTESENGTQQDNQTEQIYTPSGPVATSADNDKWGWNTENLPFSHSTPNMADAAYNCSNASVRVNTRELYNEHAHENRVNCVYYARARYLEVNGLEKYPFSINTVIKDPEYIKNGNCVVRFNGHSVYVEHYDEANNVVWFSDSNMGNHPDGALQSMSFEDFKKFNGGFQYAEGIVD